MPRGAPRNVVAFRLGGAVTEVDRVARQEATNRSGALRILIRLGLDAYRAGKR